jgi:predicted RNA-binding protein YlqC (UPF0109 family)
MARPQDESPSLPTNRESNWILGEALPDEEQLARQPIDTADDPNDPEKGTETNDDESVADLALVGETRNILESWQIASSTTRFPYVRLIGTRGATPDETLLACVGYTSGPDGTIALEIASALYAVSVDVPEDGRGRVVGQGQRNIQRLRDIPGILACDFDGRQGPLVVVGVTETAIKTVLEEIARPPTRFTGMMRMPPGASPGKLFGKGGATINQLRDRSGCAWAKYEADSQLWELAGPTAESITAFIALASQIIPGCTGEVARPPAIGVVDITRDAQVDDWREATLGSCGLDAWGQLLERQLQQPAESGPEDDAADGRNVDAT